MADTKKNSAGQQQPVDDKSRYAKMSALDMSKELAQEVNLSDEIVPRSVGAKYRNYDIRMPNGETAHLAEGTHITNKQVFAGAGTKTPIRDVDRLVKQYGGKTEKWTKVKAEAILDLHGKTFDAEIHWYEEPTVGKQEMKYKKR
jgi:hypothetical protein